MACVITSWLGSGKIGDAYRPELGSVYNVDWTDKTAQPTENLPPKVDLYSVVVDCAPATLTQIAADDRFRVLWSDSTKTALPTLEQHAALRTALIEKGMATDDLDATIGAAPNGRTWEALEKQLNALLHQTPKKTLPGWYASPDGKPENSGGYDSPWDLSTALNSRAILPGDTLWLREGVYKGDYICKIGGVDGSKITIRPYPDDTVIIDGSFTVDITSPGYIKFFVPIIVNTNAYRGTSSDPAGSNERPGGIVMLAPGLDIIGGYVIDTGVSIGSWAIAHGSTIYGTVCINGGWVDEVRWHSHAIYAQNEIGKRPVRHCFFGPHFGRTLALYGKGAEVEEPTIRGYDISECVFVERTENTGGNLLIGGHYRCRLDDIHLRWNHIIGAVQAQYLNQQSGAIEITDNTIWGRNPLATLLVGYWETPTVKGNFVNGKSPLDDVVQQEMVRWTPPLDTSQMVNVWDENEYHYTGEFAKMFRVNDNTQDYRYDFPGWQKGTGFDGNSTYDDKDVLPDNVNVYPNEYQDEHDPRCGMVVIWNGAGADEIRVDLSAMGLRPGGGYKLVQALDPLGDVTEFVYSGAEIPIDMCPESHSVACPIGWPVPLTETTLPRFAAFLVEEI